MHPLEKKVEKHIRRGQLVRPAETVLVGFSAGPDSTALLHILLALRGRLQIRLVAAYADHGLRPREVEAEKQVVLETADKHGIACEIGVLPVGAHAREQGLSIESAARELRYRFLREVAAATGAARIAVGHTADDQAEELLLRLIRGTGRKGLSGMLPLFGEAVVRPLLSIPKEEVEHYLRDRGIACCRDSSNQDRRYLRNRVRLDLLPYLEARFNPNMRETLRQTAAILQEEEGLLDALTGQAWEAVAAGRGGAGLRLRRAELRRQPLALQRRLVEKALLASGNLPSFKVVAQVLELAAGSSSGVVHCRKGLRVARQEEMLVFSHPVGRVRQRGNLAAGPPPSYRVVVPQPGQVDVPEIGRQVLVELIEPMAPADLHADPASNVLDAGRAPFPLVIRNARPGDRFRPLGAPGSKKVADFFRDRKVAARRRAAIPVLLTGDTIVALIGMQISHEARVTATSRQLLRITLLPA